MTAPGGINSIETHITHDCSLGGLCGGCFFAGKTYGEQFLEKDNRVRSALCDAVPQENFGRVYRGIFKSPAVWGYRNKMEYSFGDCMKDGPLTLGFHKKKSFYDVIDVNCCRITHNDFNMAVEAAAGYFRRAGVTYVDKKSHKGYLRHLLIRRSESTGEMLIGLVTSSQRPLSVKRHRDIYAKDLFLPEGGLNPVYGAAFVDEGVLLGGFTELMLETGESEGFEGSISGVLHIVNDSLSDAVRNDSTDILYGTGRITESVMGLKFEITPFSFFQTNTKGAELLYKTAAGFIQESLGKDITVYDLYSGTGTIAQMLSPYVKQVTGVEIVEEAAEAARANAQRNGIKNCTFIADDVLKALDYLPAPGLIVLDPPRDGVNPKALRKIIDYGVKNILYISCKPESLKRDLVMLNAAGYAVEKAAAIDQFAWTDNVETVVLMSIKDRKPDTHINVSLDMDDYHRIIGDEEEPEV